MKITLAMPYKGHEPDDTIDVDTDTGRDLIRCGWARHPEPAATKPVPAEAPSPASPTIGQLRAEIDRRNEGRDEADRLPTDGKKKSDLLAVLQADELAAG